MNATRKILTINFSKEFDKEYKYVCGLNDEGLSRSYWICTAIREKIDREQSENKAIQNLEDRIETLEKTVLNGCLPAKQETIDVVDNSADKDLIESVGIFEF